MSTKPILYSVVASSPDGQVTRRNAPNFAQAMVVARELQNMMRSSAVWIQPAPSPGPPSPAPR